MTERRFDNFYGKGASDLAKVWISNPATRSDWALGKLSIKEAMANGFYWNPLAGEEVFRYSYYSDDKNFVNIYYSGQWVNINKPAGQGGDADTPEWITNTSIGVGAFMPANITKEVIIDYARTTGNIGKTGINYLRVVKGTGVAGSVLGIGVSGYYIYHDYNKNGNGFADVSGWDIADVGIGTTGLAVSGLVTLGLVSNPVGWGVSIGTGVYFLGRLIYDVATDD